MIMTGKIFLYLLVAALVFSALAFLVWGICLSGLFLFDTVLVLIFCLGATFCDVVHKFAGDPKDTLEETDKVWLVAISPFHKLSNWQRNKLNGAQGKVLLTILFMVELILSPLSIVGGAISMMPEILREVFL